MQGVATHHGKGGGALDDPLVIDEGAIHLELQVSCGGEYALGMIDISRDVHHRVAISKEGTGLIVPLGRVDTPLGVTGDVSGDVTQRSCV